VWHDGSNNVTGTYFSKKMLESRKPCVRFNGAEGRVILDGQIASNNDKKLPCGES
jgi:hypothetical protein